MPVQLQEVEEEEEVGEEEEAAEEEGVEWEEVVDLGSGTGWYDNKHTNVVCSQQSS